MVRLIAYNLSYSEGFKGSWWGYLRFWRIFHSPIHQTSKISEFLKEQHADILSLVEVDTGSIRVIFKDTVKYFMASLGLMHAVEAVKYPEHTMWKILRYIPIYRKQSNAILSRYNFEDVKKYELHKGTKRAVIEATVRCPEKVTLFLAHLALGKKTRRKQVRELIDLVNNTRGPVILKGDFNAKPDSAEIRMLIAATRLVDSFHMNKGKIKKTFPTYKPKSRIDYILTSKDIKVKDFSILDCEFSDHLPVMIDFEV